MQTSRLPTVRFALLGILAALAIPACSGSGGDPSNFVVSDLQQAQHGSAWVWQNPLALGNNLWSLAAADPCLWAAGDGGALLVSHDRGGSWTALSSGVTSNLRGVSALASGQVWAVGEGGVIVHSPTGEVFTRQPSGMNADLFAVAFVSPAKGWAAGAGIVLRTLDGGVTWSSQALGNPNQPFLSIAFVNETTGWVTTPNGGVYNTLDGGTTWTLIGSPFNGFISMFFRDALNGWAVYGGTSVQHTIDGGSTWETQPTGVNRIVGRLLGVHMVDLLNGWAVGDAGDIVHTTDGGMSWPLQPGPAGEVNLRAVLGFDASHVATVGSNGQILSTADAGATWTDPFSGSRADLISLAVLDENEVWALSGFSQSGSIDLLHTADGGAHWVLQAMPALFTSIVVNQYTHMSQPVVWATDTGHVFQSLDRGQTWTSFPVPVPPTGGLDIVSFPDPMHGWAAGSQGIVFATNDGGASWTPQNSGTSDDILHLQFANATTGWIGAGFGKGLRGTKDGGVTWTDQFPAGTSLTVWDLAVIDEKRVVAASTHGSAPGGGPANLALTTDGGATWTFQQMGPEFSDVRSVAFVNPKKGWLLVDEDSVYGTADGGATWSLLPRPTVQNFARLRFANPNVGWIIGPGGSILKTTTGGE